MDDRTRRGSNIASKLNNASEAVDPWTICRTQVSTGPAAASAATLGPSGGGIIDGCPKVIAPPIPSTMVFSRSAASTMLSPKRRIAIEERPDWLCFVDFYTTCTCCNKLSRLLVAIGSRRRRQTTLHTNTNTRAHDEGSAGKPGHRVCAH